jgi:predicted PurR-regulated permease PerM
MRSARDKHPFAVARPSAAAGIYLMNEVDKPAEELPAESGEEQAGSGSRHVLGLLIAAAVLYVAKAVFMPIAIASILAVIASPVSARLERHLGRILSAALIVAFAIAFVVGSIYFFTIELGDVANEVTQYSGNIAAKISSVRSARPSWMGRFESMIEQLADESPAPRAKTARKQQSAAPATPSKSITEWLSPVVPLIGGVFGGLFETFMVMVLMFFLLYDRLGLRDRLVRLAVRARVDVASQALDTAGQHVSRYLLYYSLINLGFGIAVALVCWGFGLERPELWGALSFFLRFIPYIGALTSGLLPTLVALAIFPGWLHAIGILASYSVLDQFIAQFVEPFVIGAGVGVSPVALLVSAIFWAWLWGPIGLVLSTPFTVCLKVAGDYIPALGFFSILLGEDVALEGYHDYYRKLLEQDVNGAREVAIRYCDQHGIQQTFAALLLPAIELADRELERANITPANCATVVDVSRQLATELGDRFAKPRVIPRLRILGVYPPENTEPVALTMLIQLLRLDGYAASSPRPENIALPPVELVTRQNADLIVAAWSGGQTVEQIEDWLTSVVHAPHRLPVIGLGHCDDDERLKLYQMGLVAVFRNPLDARRIVWRYGTRAGRDRRSAAIPSVPVPQRRTGEAPHP